jgi:hypothetical protein
MTLHYLVRVKFRVFRITVGTLERSGSFTVPSPVPVQLPPFSHTILDEHGVLVRIWSA